MKKSVFILSLFMVLGFTTPKVSFAIDYQVIDLGSWQPFAINESGQIVGSKADKGVLWDNGSMATLSNPLGQLALDINNSGQVVGQSDSQPYIWDRTNGMQLLQNVNGAAHKINDSGEIVGWINTNNTIQNVLWSNGNSINLGVASSSGATGVYDFGINNQGQAVFPQYTDGKQQAILWDNGATSKLSDFIPTGINENGQIIGRIGWDFSVLYNMGSITYLGIAGSQTVATGINNLGQVVGYDSVSSNRAFIWQNSQLTDLNDLFSQFSDTWYFEKAYDINDDGEIIGTGTYFDKENNQRTCRAFLLTTKQYNQVPEPTTILLLVLGLIGLGGGRRKFKN